MADRLVFSVTQLNAYVKSVLEADPNLTYVFVVGEISNLVRHKSGHLYLSLKDERALVRAVMFRSNAERLRFAPESGMSVLCRGRVSLYEADGKYQLYIDEMQPYGQGALRLAFEQMTARLRAEGLFDESRKRPIPAYPERIAVITSPTGAALQDIKTILGRRFPCARILLCPALVQGEEAPAQLTAALRAVNRDRLADVIIIGRGGGSLEELWAFNDEGLARAVADSEIPVISAVGHETDYTICDFAADLRAPTPSAAAELAVPDRRELAAQLASVGARLSHAARRSLTQARAELDALRAVRALRAPQEFSARLRGEWSERSRALSAAYGAKTGLARESLALAAARLNALSPLQTLARGYAVVSDARGIVTSARTLRPGGALTLRLADGGARCTVDAVDVPEDRPAE